MHISEGTQAALIVFEGGAELSSPSLALSCVVVDTSPVHMEKHREKGTNIHREKEV